MIKTDGSTVILKCDCHHGGHEVTMAKVSDGRLTIIATRYGDSHVVSLSLDKLREISVLTAGTMGPACTSYYKNGKDDVV